MSNIYQPILLNKITDEVVIEILNAVIPSLKKLNVEYFVVGAFARDVKLLAKGFDESPARKPVVCYLPIFFKNLRSPL